MRSFLFVCCTILAVGLLGIAGFLISRPTTTTEPPFQIDALERDLGKVPCTLHEVVIQVTNPADRPRTILGATEGCRGNVCYSASRSEATCAVAPGQTVPYKYELDVRQPGPFEIHLVMFLEDNGIREVPLVIRGIGVAPEGNH